MTGGAVAGGAGEVLVPASDLRAAQLRIKELDRALGKKAMEIEILAAARHGVKGLLAEYREIAARIFRRK